MMVFGGLSSKICIKPSIPLDLFSYFFLFALWGAAVSPFEFLMVGMGFLEPSIFDYVGCLPTCSLDPTIYNLLKLLSWSDLSKITVLRRDLKCTEKLMMAWFVLSLMISFNPPIYMPSDGLLARVYRPYWQKQIFMDLHKLLGKPITVGNDSLTLTMLKFSNNDYLDEATTIEHYCKLNVALSVMHECFEPIKETHTKKDLIEDIIFNKRSDLNRLNFSGFYIVLLERDDEIISVATVRIYGANVAEIPLVGTRFQYRRKGMCHILLDVLEKKLAELGVERLVLPAIPQTLHTWTNSFGFSKMMSTERLKFLQYTFLDFPDTIMCQKVMRKAPEPFQPTGNCNQLEDEIDLNDTHADLFSEEIEAVNSQLDFLEPIPDEMSFQL